MLMDAGLARAHFITMALLDEEEPIADTIKRRRELFKACNAQAGGDSGFQLLVAIEAFVANVCSGSAKQQQVAEFDQALRACWEWEVTAPLRAFQY